MFMNTPSLQSMMLTPMQLYGTVFHRNHLSNNDPLSYSLLFDCLKSPLDIPTDELIN